MRARVLIAVCVLLATVTEVPLAAALDATWSNIADDTGNSLTYFVETKQELFVFGKVSASITTPDTITVTAPSASARSPATSTSAPATNTSVPATSTIAPARSTIAPAASTSAPATSSSAPATSSSAMATGNSVLTMGTDALSTTSNSLLPSSTIPPGYKYYPTTGSYYKFYKGYDTRFDANTTCASEGAHLVVINDALEADIIHHFVENATGDNYIYIWTGLRDNRPGGVMEWRTGNGESLSDVYNVWGDGRPYYDAKYACTLYDTYFKRLWDVPCDGRYSYTCEMTVTSPTVVSHR